MISDTDLISIIKHDTKTSQDDLEEEQIENHNIISENIVESVNIENKHLSITKAKSLNLLNSIFENDKCIERSLSEPKKIKRLNIKLRNS